MLQNGFALAPLFLLALAPIGLRAQTLEGCEISGLWTLPDGVGQVEFTEGEEGWVGRIVQLPEEAEEGAVVGWEIVREVRVNEGKNRYDARLHPNPDRSVNDEIKCLEDGRLEVKGKMAFLRRTMRWTRPDEA